LEQLSGQSPVYSKVTLLSLFAPLLSSLWVVLMW
jgi:hypothetical protein